CESSSVVSADAPGNSPSYADPASIRARSVTRVPATGARVSRTPFLRVVVTGGAAMALSGEAAGGMAIGGGETAEAAVGAGAAVASAAVGTNQPTVARSRV